MRTFRFLMLAALATGSLALMAPGANAAAPAASATELLQGGVRDQQEPRRGPVEGWQPVEDRIAAAEGRQVRAVEGQEPRWGRWPTTSTRWPNAKGNVTDIGKALGKDAAKYGKAVATFTSYYTQNCTGVS